MSKSIFAITFAIGGFLAGLLILHKWGLDADGGWSAITALVSSGFLLSVGTQGFREWFDATYEKKVTS